MYAKTKTIGALSLLIFILIALQPSRTVAHDGSSRKSFGRQPAKFTLLRGHTCIVEENQNYQLKAAIFENTTSIGAQFLADQLRTFEKCDLYTGNRIQLTSCDELLAGKYVKINKILCIGHANSIFKFKMVRKRIHGGMQDTTTILKGEKLVMNPTSKSVYWKKVIAKRVSKCDDAFEVNQEKEIYDKLNGEPNTFKLLDFYSSKNNIDNSCTSSFIFEAIEYAKDGYEFWLAKPIIINFIDGIELLLKMLYEISGVLQTMDSKGLFHSDVKLENILVEPNINIRKTKFYLFDFGGSWNKKWKLGSFQLLMTAQTVSPNGLKLAKILKKGNEKKAQDLLNQFGIEHKTGYSGCLDMYSLSVEFLAALHVLCQNTREPGNGNEHPFYTFCGLADAFDKANSFLGEGIEGLDDVYKERNKAFDSHGQHIINNFKADGKVVRFFQWLAKSIERRLPKSCLIWDVHRKNLDDIRSNIRKLDSKSEKILGLVFRSNAERKGF